MISFLTGDPRADRIVPPTGFTANLTVFAGAAMAFLAVFVLALSVASSRLADRWSAALSDTATVRISAPADQMARQTERVLSVLSTTPGVTAARAITPDETAALLAPWVGPDLPVADLPMPQLIEIAAAPQGFDAEGLGLRLAAEAPGAVLDDHTRWRAPLIAAASRLRLLSVAAAVLIAGAMAGMVTLAAHAALAANGQVIRVLRLVGARDTYIARAFVRRFTIRALIGAVGGSVVGVLVLSAFFATLRSDSFLAGLSPGAGDWVWVLAVPVFAALTAFAATRLAAFRTLRSVT